MRGGWKTCSPSVRAMEQRWRDSSSNTCSNWILRPLRVVRALIGGVVPVELSGVRDDFREAIGKRWSPWFRTFGFDDHSSNALVWVMTGAYLSLAELAENGEIGADEAANILAMLADGIVQQVAPLPAAAS